MAPLPEDPQAPQLVPPQPTPAPPPAPVAPKAKATAKAAAKAKVAPDYGAFAVEIPIEGGFGHEKGLEIMDFVMFGFCLFFLVYLHFLTEYFFCVVCLLVGLFSFSLFCFSRFFRRPNRDVWTGHVPPPG